MWLISVSLICGKGWRKCNTPCFIGLVYCTFNLMQSITVTVGKWYTSILNCVMWLISCSVSHLRQRLTQMQYSLSHRSSLLYIQSNHRQSITVTVGKWYTSILNCVMWLISVSLICSKGWHKCYTPCFIGLVHSTFSLMKSINCKWYYCYINCVKSVSLICSKVWCNALLLVS